MKEKIIELRKKGFSYNEIVKKLNCSKSTVSYHCSKLEYNDEKISKNRDIKNKKQIKDKSFLLKNVDIDSIISLRKDNKTYEEIRKITNESLHSIKKVCKENGLKIKPKNVIDDDKIILIKRLHDEHNSIRKVAKILGINIGTVSKYTTKKERKKNISRSQAVVNWRTRTKKKLVDYKGGKCIMCGYDKCIDALEFHHRDPIEKDFTISGKSWSFERLKSEADKCDLVCSNCHKEIHYKLKYIPH